MHEKWSVSGLDDIFSFPFFNEAKFCVFFGSFHGFFYVFYFIIIYLFLDKNGNQYRKQEKTHHAQFNEIFLEFFVCLF